ncbi:MAG: GNAT family N-acetyltransferase [Deltaproteobacteria bacterium]|nr:GNAT family N-acetyltransferase [Nannocystaceae bacterium]
MISTARLLLRPFRIEDAETVQKLAGDPEVAATTLTLPQPYSREAAVTWIASHDPASLAGTGETFAITRAVDSALLGAVGLQVQARHRRADLGYWVGREFWGCGFATEAVLGVLRFAFVELNLHRVTAAVLGGNVASARVLQKVGMTLEGNLRDQVFKNETFRNLEHHGMLADEYSE